MAARLATISSNTFEQHWRPANRNLFDWFTDMWLIEIKTGSTILSSPNSLEACEMIEKPGSYYVERWS